jgi:uncharacterized protein YoxC
MDIFGIEIGAFVLAASTIVLVCVTGYYAKQTKTTVKVLEQTAKLSVQPHLKGTFQQIGPVAGDLLIRNVGNGSANRINLSYWIEGKDETKRNWTKPLMMPNDDDEFFIPKNEKESIFEGDYFKQNQTTIRIVGEYYDILGNKYEINDSIDITAYVKQWEQTQVRYKEEPEEKVRSSIEKISRSVDDVGREVRKLASKFDKESQ